MVIRQWRRDSVSTALLTVQRGSSEVLHPVASYAMYEGRDRGANPISVVTEYD